MSSRGRGAEGTAAYHSLRKGGTLMAKDVLKKKLRGFPTGSLSIRVSGS